MPSAQTYLTRAFRALGVFEAVETPPAEDLADGLVLLNDLVASWALEPYALHRITRAVLPLVDGTASYTIGSGGTWNRARPVSPSDIMAAGLVLDRTATTPVEIALPGPLSVPAYARIATKSAEGTPSRLFYDANWSTGLGTITVYPTPDSSLADLILYVREPLTAFADLSTVYTFPPGYDRAIRTNLALTLAPEWDAVPSPELRAEASRSLTLLKRANIRVPQMTMDPALVGGSRRYDIEAV